MVQDEDAVNIRISRGMAKLLRSKGIKGETYEQILTRLIKK